jgi:hypothetical protein
LLVRRFDLIKTKPRGLLVNCAQHIGVDPAHWCQADLASLRQPVFAGSGEPIRPSLRPVLEEIYLGKIRRLSAYLELVLSDLLCPKG